LPQAFANGFLPRRQATASSCARPKAHPEQHRPELRKLGSSATVVAKKRPNKPLSHSSQRGDGLDFCDGRDVIRRWSFADQAQRDGTRERRKLGNDGHEEMTDMRK
jgi:hypothetical protein